MATSPQNHPCLRSFVVGNRLCFYRSMVESKAYGNAASAVSWLQMSLHLHVTDSHIATCCSMYAHLGGTRLCSMQQHWLLQHHRHPCTAYAVCMAAARASTTGKLACVPLLQQHQHPRTAQAKFVWALSCLCSLSLLSCSATKHHT